jgi:hypothetical protein
LGVVGGFTYPPFLISEAETGKVASYWGACQGGGIVITRDGLS